MYLHEHALSTLSSLFVVNQAGETAQPEAFEQSGPLFMILHAAPHAGFQLIHLTGVSGSLLAAVPGGGSLISTSTFHLS